MKDFQMTTGFFATCLEIITDTVRGPIQRLYNMPDPKLPVKYPRTPGYRPSSQDNPYGAW